MDAGINPEKVGLSDHISSVNGKLKNAPFH